MDILERLKVLDRKQLGEYGKWDVSIALDISDAIAEIERLRSLAGAVSAGTGDYRTIAKDARHDICGNE